MRRTWILALTLVTVTALALPAFAKKPPPPQDDILYGTECGGEPVGGPDDLKTEFTVTVTDKTCLDVWVPEGTWTIEAETTGTVRSLLVVPRDSVAPGDSCGGYSFRNEIPATFTLPGPDHPSDIDGDGRIEGSYANSCGIQFGEIVGGVEYADVDESAMSPLALQVFVSGKGGSVTLVVTVAAP